MHQKFSSPRVLIVSNTQFLPATQGDSRRLLGIVAGLQRNGITVGVMNLHDNDQRDADYSAMRDHCSFLDVYYPDGNEMYQRDSRIDSWCPDPFLKRFRENVVAFSPDVVLAQFVYLSRCLAEIGDQPRILKVLDADNIFQLRQETFSHAGIRDDWLQTTAEQEVMGWRRADLVLSIQREEGREILKRLPQAAVLPLYPSIPSVRLKIPGSRSLLFVGANNPANVRGLQRFAAEALPRVEATLRDVRLDVVGGVCDGLRVPIGKSMRLHGIQEDLTGYYERAAIALNLVEASSGINIKLIEALGHGRCVVSTPAGARSVCGLTNSVVIARHGTPMASKIVKLLTNADKLKRLSNSVYEFAFTHFSEANTTSSLSR